MSFKKGKMELRILEAAVKYQRTLKVNTLFYVCLLGNRLKISEVKDKERQARQVEEPSEGSF